MAHAQSLHGTGNIAVHLQLPNGGDIVNLLLIISAEDKNRETWRARSLVNRGYD